MKRALTIALILIIGLTSISADTYAASKVKKGTVYFCIKSGDYVYCTNHRHVFQVDLQYGKITKLYSQKYSYVDMLSLKGNYLYYLDHGSDVTSGHVYRINLKTKKKNLLASNVEDYIISGSKIYYISTKFSKKNGYKSTNKVMNFDGTSKKITKNKVRRVLIESNAGDYYIWDDFNGSNMTEVNYYLRTPKKDVLLETGPYYL